MRALTLLLLICCASVAQAELPLRIEAGYDILKQGIKLAEVREVFIRSGDRYQVESVTRPVGLLALFQPETIVVTSEGDITEKGLQPLHFSYRRVRNAEKDAKADFDWQRNELTLNTPSGIRLLSLPPGTQDRLSIMYQFAIAPPHGKLHLSFHMTNGHKVEEYHYQLNPTHTVEVPFGKLRSYYLYTLPQKTAWKSEVWLAADHGYMPCKVVVTEDSGDQLVQVLRTLNISP